MIYCSSSSIKAIKSKNNIVGFCEGPWWLLHRICQLRDLGELHQDEDGRGGAELEPRQNQEPIQLNNYYYFALYPDFDGGLVHSAAHNWVCAFSKLPCPTLHQNNFCFETNGILHQNYLLIFYLSFSSFVVFIVGIEPGRLISGT